MKRFLPLLLASMFVLVAGSASATAPYYAPGSYQGWDIGTAIELKDDGTGGDATAADGIYSATVTIATMGAHEWKAAEAGWAASWPGSGNSWFITTADAQDVLLTFDTNAHGDGWAADSYWPDSDHARGNTYTLVGNIGSELGGFDWDPAGTLYLHDDGIDDDLTAGDGVYTFCNPVSTAGTYEWKVAVNGGWAQQFGVDGPGVNSATWFVTVANDSDPWCFYLDALTGRIKASPNEPVADRQTTWGLIKTRY